MASLSVWLTNANMGDARLVNISLGTVNSSQLSKIKPIVACAVGYGVGVVLGVGVRVGVSVAVAVAVGVSVGIVAVNVGGVVAVSVTVAVGIAVEVGAVAVLHAAPNSTTTRRRYCDFIV